MSAEAGHNSVRPDTQPWLSVLMPTFNGARHLEEALHSIVEQSHTKNIEILAVDDGSTDRTYEILSAFSEKLPLEIYRLPHSGNWVANINYALERARGFYITILHQDDRWACERLKILYQLTQSWPQAVLFSHPVWFIDACGHRLGMCSNPLSASPPLHTNTQVIERLLIQNWIALPAPIFNRQVALSVGGMDTALLYSADWDFWLKLINCGDLFYYPRPLAEVRIHPGSQTIEISSDSERFNQELQTVFDRHMSIWRTRLRREDHIRKIGLCSIALNCALADAFHRRTVHAFRLSIRIFALGPRGWYRLWRDTRIFQRTWPRLRLRREERR